MLTATRKVAVVLCPIALAAILTPTSAGQDKKPHVDFFGDPLPDGALVRHGTIRLRHQGSVRSLSFTPDGQGLLSLGADQTFRQWDVATGKEQWRFEKKGLELFRSSGLRAVRGRFGWVHQNILFQSSSSADGRRLALLDTDDSAIVMDTMSCKEARNFKLKTAGFAIAISPDGELLAVLESNEGEALVRLWNVSTGKELPSLKVGSAFVITKLLFSSDAKLLAGILNGNSIRIWNVSSAKRVGLYVHELQEGNFRGIHDGYRETVMIQDIAFSRDGRMIASAGFDQVIRVWETGSEEELHVLRGTSPVSSLAFTPDGHRLVAGDQASHISIWDLSTESKKTLEAGAPIANIAVSGNGCTIATSCEGGAIQLWNMVDGTERMSSKRLPPLAGLGMTENGSALVLWNLIGNAVEIDTLTGENRRSAKAPIIQDLRSMQMVVAPNGKVAALTTRGENEIVLWDGVAGAELRKIADFTPPVRSLAFSADGRSLLSTDQQSVVHLWNVANGKQSLRADVIGNGGTFSQDGRFLAVASYGGNVSIVERANAKERLQFHNSGMSVELLSFSADSRYLAAGGDDIVRIWDLMNGRMIHAMIGHVGNVAMLAFSPNDHALASGGEDGTVRLWDVDTGKQTRCFKGHLAAVRFLAWSPDAKMLVSAGHDDCILVWDPHSQPTAQAKDPPQKLDRCWSDLASSDAKIAFQAIGEMIGQPKETVAFLAGKLKPVAQVDPDLIEKLVADLDSDNFNKRTKATKELETIDTQARPALEKMLAKPPSAEARNRAKNLLDKLDGAIPSQEELRVYRAVEVLERIGDAEARELLARLSKGAPAARMTIEAKSSLGRMLKK